jgi:molybdopterin synthase catalytic subunit
MEREEYRHGFDPNDWERGKEEARAAMYAVAAKKRTISYSGLVSQIRSLRIDAHDPRLAHFLGQIAREDDDNGLGLTTVVVVHKSGDQQPGPGFFEMAQSQGRTVLNAGDFWIEELNRVHDHWSKSSK